MVNVCVANVCVAQRSVLEDKFGWLSSRTTKHILHNIFIYSYPIPVSKYLPKPLLPPHPLNIACTAYLSTYIYRIPNIHVYILYIIHSTHTYIIHSIPIYTLKDTHSLSPVAFSGAVYLCKYCWGIQNCKHMCNSICLTTSFDQFHQTPRENQVGSS